MARQKSILCYGDSNTWGYVPSAEDHALPPKRYRRHERWTGLLQKQLGDEFYVIEEGLNSRTTNIDHTKLPDRNGKNYLPSCLYSQAPLDLVILALGGNDAKTYFNRSAADITAGMRELVEIVQNSPYGPDMASAPQVLIIPPALPHAISESYLDESGISFFAGGIQKIQQLPVLYAALAQEKQCHFLNIAHEVLPSPIDGVHFDQAAHAKFAALIAAKIKTLSFNIDAQ